jgi:hypothetical protein
MEESRTQRLQQLLRRLGQAVHGSVVQSKEVRECLDELREDGWRAVMLLEASLACRDGGALDVEDGSIHIHVATTEITADYRIDATDARLLSALGISPSRHRSQATPVRLEYDSDDRRLEADDEPGRQDG